MNVHLITRLLAVGLATGAIGAGGALVLLVSVGGISYRHRHERLGVAR